MKEAVGGTFMIYVLLIFLAVYIAFVAVALNYAKAFRVKNSVIDIIEQNEGMDESDFTGREGNITTGVVGQINAKLNNYHYNISLTSDEVTKYCGSEENKFGLGYCISKKENNLGREYYQVVTFVQIKFPFWEDFNITIPIRGETRVIERINNN